MKKIELDFTPLWKVNQHQWYENDEDFSEDLLQATYKDYLLDVGFYRDNAETGIYKMYVIKGDFLNGILIEKYQTSDLEEMKTRVNYYLRKIPNQSFNLEGFPVIIDGLINGKVL